MIEKNVQAIKGVVGDALENKAYNHAVSSLPGLLDSMRQDEYILYAFTCILMKKNGGRESATYLVGLLTNKRFYYSGKDGKSSIFLPMTKAGSVDLRDVHAITVGKQLMTGFYISFETKNEDYNLTIGSDEVGYKIKTFFDEAINMAQETCNNNTTIQNALSPADELKKFKELLDMGVITQEEFDQKKKQLLGL